MSLSEDSGNKMHVDYSNPQLWLLLNTLIEFVLEPVVWIRPLNTNKILGSSQTGFHTLLSRDTPCLKPSQIFLMQKPRAHSESSCWVQTQLVLCAFRGMQTHWGGPRGTVSMFLLVNLWEDPDLR